MDHAEGSARDSTLVRQLAFSEESGAPQHMMLPTVSCGVVPSRRLTYKIAYLPNDRAPPSEALEHHNEPLRVPARWYGFCPSRRVSGLGNRAREMPLPTHHREVVGGVECCQAEVVRRLVLTPRGQRGW